MRRSIFDRVQGGGSREPGAGSWEPRAGSVDVAASRGLLLSGLDPETGICGTRCRMGKRVGGDEGNSHQVYLLFADDPGEDLRIAL